MPAPVLLGANRVGLVATAGNATVLRHLSAPTDPALSVAIASLPQHVQPTGTNYAAGLRTALDLLEAAPAGYARAIYMCADGEDNREREGLDAQIARARRMGVRVYVVPIGSWQAGHSFDLARLRKIADGTGGKLKSVSSMKAMAEAYQGLAARGGQDLGRAVAKVLLVDVSPSMNEAWDRTTKLAAAQHALFRFLAIEAKRE